MKAFSIVIYYSISVNSSIILEISRYHLVGAYDAIGNESLSNIYSAYSYSSIIFWLLMLLPLSPSATYSTCSMVWIYIGSSFESMRCNDQLLFLYHCQKRPLFNIANVKFDHFIRSVPLQITNKFLKNLHIYAFTWNYESAGICNNVNLSIICIYSRPTGYPYLYSFWLSKKKTQRVWNSRIFVHFSGT